MLLAEPSSVGGAMMGPNGALVLPCLQGDASGPLRVYVQ
jgi:hypothetical protein